MNFNELKKFPYLVIDRDGNVKNYDNELAEYLGEEDNYVSFDKALLYVADSKNVLFRKDIRDNDDFMTVTLPDSFTNEQKRSVNDVLVALEGVHLYANIAYYTSLTKRDVAYDYISMSGYYRDATDKIRNFMYISDLNHGNPLVKR